MTEKNLEGWYYISRGIVVALCKAHDDYLNADGKLVREVYDDDDNMREQQLWHTPNEVWDYLIGSGEEEIYRMHQLLAAMRQARATGADHAKY